MERKFDLPEQLEELVTTVLDKIAARFLLWKGEEYDSIDEIAQLWKDECSERSKTVAQILAVIKQYAPKIVPTGWRLSLKRCRYHIDHEGKWFAYDSAQGLRESAPTNPFDLCEVLEALADSELCPEDANYDKNWREVQERAILDKKALREAVEKLHRVVVLGESE